MVSSSIVLSPSPLSFGCVSIGFAYSLKICLTNVGTILERFKVTLADMEQETENKMKGFDKETEVHHITGLVVPPDNFKKITRNLKFKNKNIYVEGVECIGAISLTQSSFIVDGAPSMYSENLISDDELEELQQIPFVRNVYYNPYTKCLVQDEELSKVITGEGWSVEETQQKSQENWDVRLLELEAKGMVTERTIGQMLKERSVISNTSSILEKLQLNGDL